MTADKFEKASLFSTAGSMDHLILGMLRQEDRLVAPFIVAEARTHMIWPSP